MKYRSFDNKKQFYSRTLQGESLVNCPGNISKFHKINCTHLTHYPYSYNELFQTKGMEQFITIIQG